MIVKPSHGLFFAILIFAIFASAQTEITTCEEFRALGRNFSDDYILADGLNCSGLIPPEPPGEFDEETENVVPTVPEAITAPKDNSKETTKDGFDQLMGFVSSPAGALLLGALVVLIIGLALIFRKYSVGGYR